MGRDTTTRRLVMPRSGGLGPDPFGDDAQGAAIEAHPYSACRKPWWRSCSQTVMEYSL
ncbi:hypothetical protein FMUBM48_51010 [Nocardia cyriacigeorgica]|nr:hypothetical protein FMUBM48_51010 [Nocardia cyriacigeorgica]